MYSKRNIKNEVEELIKGKCELELELIIIDLYYDYHSLLEKHTKLKAKYE